MLPKQVAQNAVARVAASHCSELSPQSVKDKKGISHHDVFMDLYNQTPCPKKGIVFLQALAEET